MAIDFVIILIDAPAFVWYGWLDVMRKNDHCGPGDEYGIYVELALVILWYLTFKFIKEFLLTFVRFYEMTYERKNGYSEATCCSFVIIQIIVFFQKLFNELPILILAAAVLTAVKIWFFAVVFASSALVNVA